MLPQIELNSPDGEVRATLGVESVWQGSICYPRVAVWRVWYRGNAVVERGVVGVAGKRGVLGYDLQLERVVRQRPVTRFGKSRQVRARLADSSGQVLEVVLRVTGRSAFCAARRVARGRPVAAEPWGVVEYAAGSQLLGSAEVREISGSEVRFTPHGAVVASWQHGMERHLVFCDRPGWLAAERFGVCSELVLPPLRHGSEGCEHLFLTLPFSHSRAVVTELGPELTPSYCEAFNEMVEGAGAGEEYWVVRGEPSEFGVVARRRGSEWCMAGITGAARTLTLRFEDLWWRTPPALRGEGYSVEIRRDPLASEEGQQVVERFSGLRPESRVVLDLAESGGFVLRFKRDK